MRIVFLSMVCSVVATAALAQSKTAGALTLVDVRAFSADVVNVTGRVQPLVTARVGARVSGRIAEFSKDASGQMLDAGSTVKAGEVIFSLEDTTFRNSVAAAEAALAAAKANLANLTAKARPERLEALTQTVAELDVRLADRQREEQRYRRLVEQEKTLPAKRLEEVQTEVAVLTALRRAAQSRLDELRNGPTPTEIAVQQAVVHQAEVSLKIAQDDLRDSLVRAPFDGLITRRFKGPGDFNTGSPNTDVVELVSADRLEVELRLPEAYFPRIIPGKTPITLHCALINESVVLPVTRVISSIDPTGGTFAIRVSIDPQQVPGLVSGAFVTGEITIDSRNQGVVVPLAAIVGEKEQAAVFVVRDGKMVRTPVVLGDRLTESVVIRSGLAVGDRIVIGPEESLKDGQPLPEELKSAK